MNEFLLAVSALSSGLSAGALLVALCVILPLLFAVPPAMYPWTNTFVLNRMDRLMPVCVGIAVLSNAVFSAVGDHFGAGWLFVGAAVSFAVVFATSLIKLRPLNTAIRDHGTPWSDELASLRAR